MNVIVNVKPVRSLVEQSLRQQSNPSAVKPFHLQEQYQAS